MDKATSFARSSATGSFVLSEPSQTGRVVPPVAPASRPKGAASTKAVQHAVYGHLRAIRALGVTTISTDQVARSLSLPRAQVEAAISTLRGRGVKVIR